MADEPKKDDAIDKQVVGAYESDTQVHQIKKPITCDRSEHLFVQRSGTEAECVRCPIGFNIGVGTEVKNGHIYLHGTLLI